LKTKECLHDYGFHNPALSVLLQISMFYVYVLKSKKQRFLYVGYTSDLKKRIALHNSKRASRNFTNEQGPWSLVYYEAYLNEHDARDREAALKNYGAGLGHLRKRLKKSIESAGSKIL
jgi:putative endonuclease